MAKNTQDLINKIKAVTIGEKFTTPYADQFLELADAVGMVEPMKMILRKHALEPKSVKRYAAIVDFTQHSRYKRFYLLDAVADTVERYHVAHGSSSEGDKDDGFADIFSNVPDSRCSSLGVYKVTTTYSGKHGLSCILEGLDKTNSNAKNRSVVLHGAAYAGEYYIAKNGYTGRSWGCPAIPQSKSAAIINKLKGGSFLIVWGKSK